MINMANPMDFLDFIVDAYKSLSEDFKTDNGMKSPRVKKISPVKFKKGNIEPPQSARETKLQDQEKKEIKMSNKLKFNRFEKLLMKYVVEKETEGQLLYLIINPDGFQSDFGPKQFAKKMK
jgi:hypothetical protein